MRGKFLRFEVVLHAYRHLGWDRNDILRSASQPAYRPPTAPSPAPPPDWFSRYSSMFSNSRSQLPLHFFLAPLLHYPSLIFRFTSMFAIQSSAANAINDRRRAFTSFSAVQSPQSSYQAAGHCQVGAPFLRHSSSRSRAPSKDPASSPCGEWFYEPGYGRANPTRNGTPENPPKFSSSILPSPRHKAPYAPNQYSSLATQSGTRNHSYSRLPPHSPLPSLLLANNKYQITYHCAFQGSSTLRLLLPPLSLLS